MYDILIMESLVREPLIWIIGGNGIMKYIMNIDIIGLLSLEKLKILKKNVGLIQETQNIGRPFKI